MQPNAPNCAGETDRNCVKGGELIASGTPEQIAKCKASSTGKFLKTYLTKNQQLN